jgi:hypothetical protein
LLTIIVGFSISTYSQIDYNIYYLNIPKLTENLERNKQFISQHKIKTKKIYKINNETLMDSILSSIIQFDTIGNCIEIQTFSMINKKLEQKVKFTYHDYNLVEIKQLFYNESFSKSPNSCYSHSPVLSKFHYSNKLISEFISFYPNNKIADYYIYHYDSLGKILEIYNKSAGIKKLVNRYKYNYKNLLVSDSFLLDQQRGYQINEYKYDSMQNTIEMRYIYPEGQIAIETNDYSYHSDREIAKIIEYNISKQIKCTTEYTRRDSILVKICNKRGNSSETHYNSNGKVLFFKDNTISEQYEYDKNNLLVKFNTIYLKTNSAIELIYRYEFFK